MPTVVPVDAFTMPIAPPPPPGLTPSKGAITIPVQKPGANFGKGISNLFNVGDLDNPPVARVRQAPSYPYDMRRAGINGTVVVELLEKTTTLARSAAASAGRQASSSSTTPR